MMRETVSKRSIEETVYGASLWSDEWPEKLVDLVNFLLKHAEGIPAEYRDCAKVDFNSDYDSSGVNVEITYEREETDQEFENRQFQERATAEYRQRAHEQEERADYERLKKKFDSPIPQTSTAP